MKERKNVLGFWLFIFGFFFAFFQIMPALLPRFLTLSLTWGDLLDFLTPFAVIPLAYVLYSRALRSLNSLPDQESLARTPATLAKIFLAIGAILYIDGHGLHLSANSISRLLQGMKGSELYKANYLFDEVISHFMWDSGIFLISIGLVLLASKISLNSLNLKSAVFVSLGAAFYGFTYTVNGIEGQTVIFTFPAAGVGFLLAIILYLKRQKKSPNPFLLFFIAGYFLSLVLFAYWGISRSGFPEFSELGWI